MIEAHFPAGGIIAADGADGSRTIRGVAVPWNTPGRVSTGETVVFHPGSLDAAARPVALRDHDRTRPIGTVVDADDTGTALAAAVRVSRTGAGDEALVLAADGALPMFSVGAEPTDWRYDADGTMHVHAADWLELSLLTIGAYPSARVATVTANRGDNMLDTDNPAPVDDDTEDDETTEQTPEPEETLAMVPITAGRMQQRARPANPYRHIGLRDMSRLIAGAAGTRDPRLERQLNGIITGQSPSSSLLVNAALTDVTLVGTNNVGDLYRPAYQAELVDIVSWGSPMVDVWRQGDLERGDFPNKTFVRWNTLPQVTEQTAEKTDIGSTAVDTVPVSVPVKTWATGNDISRQLLDFGSPSFVEDYIRAAGVDYADTIDLYAVTTALAAATAVTTAAGDSFQVVLGKLFAALNPALVPAGAMFVGVSWDVGVSLMGVKDADKPAFWDGRISLGSFMPSAEMGGLQVIIDKNFPARTYLLGLRNAATWYDAPGVPYSLQAINVGKLGLDLGVYGYGALGVQYPGALVKTTVPLT